MEPLIFKTNISSAESFSKVKKVLYGTPRIYDCTIDLEDADKVLRVISEDLSIEEVEKEVNRLGFFCKELED